MHRSRLKIENKELDFEFEIVNVQFNEVGRYILRLTVENPLLEGSGTGVQLRVNDGDVLWSNTGTTDIIPQTNLNEIYSVLKKKFLFRLPKGYCQNDKNHDVRLRIEAFRVTGSSLKSGKKEGEAFFAIYPRTNAPRINVFAKENEDFYCYSNIVALLRVQEDMLTMHCGRMACNVSLHEVRLPKDMPGHDSTPLVSKEGGHSHPLNQSSPPVPTLEMSLSATASPQQWIPTPALPSPIPQLQLQNEPVGETNPEPSPEESPPPSPLEEPAIHQRLPSDSSFHLSSPEHTPVRTPEALPHTHVMETPPGKTEATLTSPTNDEHVSRPGMESISIILHGATDLPALSDGSVPQPFGTAKSGSDGEKRQGAQGVTHATTQPTYSPSWGEKVTVEIDAENAKDEVVILDIADSRTKELLASYHIPVTYLQMFHHYHVELIQPHPNIPSGVRLYITIVRKGSIIPRQESFTFTGFEVLLRAVENPLKDPVGPLLAVARIVPDYESYKDAILMKTPRLAGINVTTIKYPSLHRSFFDVLHHTSQGHPQVSRAAIPEEQPIWNCSFLFQGRDCATIFTAGAALVLEYYSITTVMNTVSWYIRSPLGFSVVPLDQGVYHKLMVESGGRGLRVDGLPVQGNHLRTTSNTNPTVGLILRLIGSELQQDRVSLPPYDALAQILPEYDYLFRSAHPKERQKREQQPAVRAPSPPQTQQAAVVSQKRESTIEDHAEKREITRLETQELDNYRAAMQKMAEDIINARKDIARLEADNSKLRSELSSHQDLGRTRLDDTDIDVMTKAEIADRIVLLRQKLASETAELLNCKDKVQQLQNELIRKNDREAELLRLQKAHQQQQAVLQKYQEKIRKLKILEDTIRQQEKVIEKMETLLDKKLKERTRENPDASKKHIGITDDSVRKEVESVLLAENTRLREEIGKLRHQPAPIILQYPVHSMKESFSDSEKLSLLAKLEKAQGRIQTLERLMEENSRKWGREKQEILTRLSESEHGFTRTSTMVLHDFPLKNASDSLLTRNRHGMLDPLA
ncbi:coiled-coil domain-containing protein 33 isoform X2 [Heterodontus francisci]|uniref:coiled-coil domain-containing protein 33 isoform X2 n=1 Tax=Heterodontus francisci TaxID=7792 RepID=UPI00355BC181